MEIEYGVSLQLLRNRSGLSQLQAAKKSRIPLDTLRKAELGQYELNMGEACRLADVYWCDKSELIAPRKLLKK